MLRPIKFSSSAIISALEHPLRELRLETGMATCANGESNVSCPPARALVPCLSPACAGAPGGAWRGRGFARFTRIETELSARRGLPFKNGVPSSTQSRGDFRAWVHAELGRELPPGKNEGLSRAYALLGLVPPGFDLTSTLEEALTTQVAAYYDPRSKAFRVVGDTRERDVDEMIVAHELTHALSLTIKHPFWGFWNAVFGNSVMPTTWMSPLYMTEGVTVSFESLDGDGRVNDPLVRES